jgi:hypothetical protein
MRFIDFYTLIPKAIHTSAPLVQTLGRLKDDQQGAT